MCRILVATNREAEYLGVDLNTGISYNPLHNDLDPYAVAYAIARLLNNLFGKSKEPFWQQAYADLLKVVMLMPSAAVALRAHKLASKRDSNVSALVAFGVLASRWTTRETLDLRNGWSLTADSHRAILQTFADAIWHPLHVDRREALIERRP